VNETPEIEVVNDAAAEVENIKGMDAILRLILGELGATPDDESLGGLLLAIVIAIRRLAYLEHPADAKRRALGLVGAKLDISPQAMCGTDVNGVYGLVYAAIDKLKQRFDETELVTAMDLQHGDYIILDDGDEVMVRAIEAGQHKDAICIRLKGRPPLCVTGYWRRIFRRVV
jgi:hypothetical protein